MRLALYQPDIPQNTGTILRMASCLNVPVDIIGPAGFDLSNRALKRAGLDYLPQAAFTLHADLEMYLQAHQQLGAGRLLLATTKASRSYLTTDYQPSDTILMGRESAGVPQNVHDLADERIRIPMRESARSLNLAVSSAMILGEALRQTGGFRDEAV